MPVVLPLVLSSLVPILTQSENWALSQSQSQSPEEEFQSSPSPKTGRYTTLSNFLARLTTVPILTQSENWALLRMLYGLKPSKGVPILTQSENWALLGTFDKFGSDEWMFQSSPSPKTGRYKPNRCIPTLI